MKVFSLVIFCYVAQIHIGIAQTPKELQGVWKYEIPGVTAYSIFSPNHAAWVGVHNKRPSGDSLTRDEKAAAFDAIWDIGISTIQPLGPGKLKSTFLISGNPQMNGKSYTVEYEVRGEYFTYWIINQDGQRGYSGKARKMADWALDPIWPNFNGLWKFEESNGYYMQCGKYDIWVIQSNPDVLPVDIVSKAKIMDGLNAAVCIGSKIKSTKEVWTSILSANPTDTGKSFFLKSFKVEGGRSQFVFDYENMSPDAQTIKSVKVK